MIDYEQIIGVYKAAYKRAVARRDMIRAQALGERLTQWIQAAERGGEFQDNGLPAFAIGRGVR